MLQVVVIGSGNVAQHLIKAFSATAEVELVQAFARNAQALENLLTADKITDSIQSLKPADVYIIAVTDGAIAGVSAQLPFNDQLVVHTSGSVALGQANSKNRRGVFYPLQTFSKNKEIDFRTIPICIESERPEDYPTLEKLANSISGSVYSISSEQRKSLHVAAVFVSNFVNHMYASGNAICEEHDIPFNILKPLIKETADKINYLSPLEAQTGPAVRNDRATIAKHLDFITDENQKAIYTLLTQSIQEANGKKL